MSDKTIQELLGRVHFFYPTSKDTDFREKANKRNSITAAKINNLIGNVDSPLRPLELEARYHWKNVYNWDAMQFPNYYFVVNLDNIDQAPHILERQRRLVLCVSLLCSYYTVFYEEDYMFTQMVTYEDMTPPIYRIYFQDLASDLLGCLKADFKKLQTLCEKYFQEHVFVDHRWIMTSTVPGMLTDTGEAQVPERSIYSYLFDNITMKVPSVLI